MVLVLMTGAGLLIESFARLMNVNSGFSPQGLMTFPLALPAARYSQNRRKRFTGCFSNGFEQFLEYKPREERLTCRFQASSGIFRTHPQGQQEINCDEQAADYVEKPRCEGMRAIQEKANYRRRHETS